MAPSLVTWPTSTSANFPPLASWISSKLDARTCATVPGALSIVSSHMVWIESITTSAASPAASQAGGDVAQVDRGGEFQRRVVDAEAAGAQAHLLDRFLAGDVEHAAALRAPGWRRPAASGWTCRCPDRRRPGRQRPARGRRPARGPARRCRWGSAAAARRCRPGRRIPRACRLPPSLPVRAG